MIATTATASRGHRRRRSAGVEGVTRRPSFPRPSKPKWRRCKDCWATSRPSWRAASCFDVGGFTEKRLVEQKGPDVARQVQEARARLAAAGCAGAGGGSARPLRLDSPGRARLCVRKPAGARDQLDRPPRPGADASRLGDADLPDRDVRRVRVDLLRWPSWPMKLIDSGKDWLIETLRDHLPAGMFTSLLVDGDRAGRRQRAGLPAADRHSLRLPGGAGGLRLHGSGRLPDGPADGALWAERQIVHPACCRRWPVPCPASWRRG